MKNVLLTLFFFTTLALNAQKYELGALIGTSSYIGDLVCLENHKPFNNLNPAYGIFGRYTYGKLSTRVGLTATSVEANDNNSHYPQRGLNFKSNILEFSGLFEYSLFYMNFKNAYLTPYLAGGAAIYRYNPMAQYNGEWIELQPYGTEGQGMDGKEDHYNLTQFAIPLGIGFKYVMKNNITIGAEIIARKLFTDYLDDVSNTELNYAELYEQNGEMAAFLSAPTRVVNSNNMDFNYKRGGEGKDMFYSIQIHISYTLNGKGASQSCPSFYNNENAPEF